MHYDILIIGSGAAGLMAMNELVQSGYKVCLLEAAANPGGRIATQKSFNEPIEKGAEFIHGKAPVTIELLKQASISYIPTEGKWITVRNGVWLHEENQEDDFKLLNEKLEQLKTDCTIRDFLDAYLPEKEYEGLRKAVRQFAEGFELADINKASTFALREEWLHQEEEQYRIPGGYMQLINYLLESCYKNDSAIHFFSPVHTIERNNGYIIAYTKNQQFSAEKIIITVSAGVLQSGALTFKPALQEHASYIQQLGFGSVIKILFRFKKAFWQNEQVDLGFLLTNETIPTWWTQLPNPTPLLTGWLGGPNAAQLTRAGKTAIYEKALFSLANIFHIDTNLLRQQLTDYMITCWDDNPYTRGGYSYDTLDSANAKSILQQPVNNTIYFAGEAIYTGNSKGTVEAALASGRSVAGTIRAK